MQSALQAIWDYNWAPDVETQNKIHPPERTYASPGESGLLVASWPYSKHMGEDGVRYRDEVWTGIEYQVASHLMMMGRVEEGLEIVRTCRARYDGKTRNPFNEYECGHWYARALSSYGMIQGLTGLRYDAVDKNDLRRFKNW